MTEAPSNMFMGQNFEYREVANRGKEILGFNAMIGSLPNGVVLMVLRFVCIAPAPYAEMAKFSHFKSRGPSHYTKGGKEIVGQKLNRLAIPLWTGGCPHSARQVGDHFQIWEMLAGYVKEQVEAEGFHLDLTKEQLTEMLRETAPDPVDHVKLALEFPDFNAPEPEE